MTDKLSGAKITIPYKKGIVNRLSKLTNLFYPKGHGVTRETMGKNYKKSKEFKAKLDSIAREHNEMMMPVVEHTARQVKEAFDQVVKQNRKACGRKKLDKTKLAETQKTL